jgi:hypothetical protein
MRINALLLICCTLLTGCLKPDPIGPHSEGPVLVLLTVEPEYGTTGRTFIAWTHKDGPNAIDGQPGIVRFTSRTASGGSRTEDVTEPFDTRVLTDGVVEFEYRHGREVMEIRIQQEDAAGRIVRYDCFGPHPDWQCLRK